MLVEALLWLALLLLTYFSFRKPPGLPPGRWGLPLVGYIPLTTKSVKQQIIDLRNKHGDLYLWRIGTQIQVFVHDHQLAREAFNRPEFQDRPEYKAFRLLDPDTLGIINSNGLIWHSNRRFTLRQLRDLGMGKSKLVSAIHTQAALVVQAFREQAGRPAPTPNALNIAVINIIWQMVAGKQFSATDRKITEFIKVIDGVVTSMNRLIVPDYMPWLYNILPYSLMSRIFAFGKAECCREKIFSYFIEEIEEHKKTLDPDNPRDLIDGYLLEMEEKKDDPNTTLSEKDLTVLIFDVFLAGNETTTNTIIWLIYYLALNPKAQCKMQAEIDQVLPRGTQVTLHDRARLPYTEAVIHETLRMSSLASLGVPHMASQDTILGGYNIPKGTILSYPNFTVHDSGRYWNRSDHFDPERWLDENDKFALKKEGFVPFGIGKRQCAGESLARMELLIFVTALFQVLNISIPPGKTLSLDARKGTPFLRLPILQDLLVTLRE